MTEHTLINNKHDDEIDPLIRITKLLLDAKNLAKENNHFTITTLIDLAIYQLKEEYRMNLEKNSKS